MALGDRRGLCRAPAYSARGKRNRYRSSKFCNRDDSCREIQLLDVNGVRSLTQLDGHMNTVTHTLVLKALEQRANRFRVKGKMLEAVARAHAWSLDDTGTINTKIFDKREILQQERIEIRGVSEEILRVQGVVPGKKRRWHYAAAV